MKIHFKLIYLLIFLIQLPLNAQYDSGSGTSGDPYIIKTSTHLTNLASTSSDWIGKYFELANDIDMSGVSFTPIGNNTQVFTGNFEGNSHVISNLTITPNATNIGTGFFGQFSGNVTRLGLDNVTITATGVNRTGGIVGYMTGGSITYCYTKGGSINVGSAGWAGGIVGVMFKSSGTQTVEDCYSSTTITAGWGSGGIVGATRGTHVINRVVFYGNSNGQPAIVTVQDQDLPDGNRVGIPPTNAFYAASTGASDTNATSLDATALLSSSSYTTFDFDRVWEIDATLNYAILQDPISDPELPFFDKIRLERVTSDQNIEWINIAPGTSGYCEEFWCHPTDANTMFSGPDMHAAFGSWDNGQSWQSLKDYDGNGFDMRRVIDIKFSLQDPDYGMAFSNNQSGSSTSGVVYETTDRGRTWSPIFNAGKCHSKMAVHPTNDNIWFLGAGDFWNVKANHRTAAAAGGAKQSRSDYGHVWKTTNKGATWTKVATSISSDLDVGRIIFDRNNPNNMIMATSHGMYRSTDLGETWTPSSTGLPNNYPRDLTSYYNSTTNEFILYAIDQTFYTANGSTINSNGGIFKSTDGGVSWQSITGNLAINLQSISNFWVRDSYHRTIAKWLGISKSTSQSIYTTYPTAALPSFNRIVVNPNDKNEIYLVQNKRHTFSFGPGDVWKTENGGTTWFACSRSGEYWINEDDKTYWQSRNNPLGANIDYSHMQRYMDEGREESSAARMLAININGDVFTGINQQLLRSNNGGDTWEQADDFETNPNTNAWVGRGNTNLPGRMILMETGVSGRKLLLSGEHGLWQTTDLGSHPNPEAVAVQQIEGQIYDGGAHSIATAAVRPDDPDIIYILMWRQEHRGKVRRTTDGGQTWSNIATIFEGSNNSWESVAYQNSLLIDPNTPDNMYFCATRKAIAEVGGSVDESILTMGSYGIYRSSDAGFNWTLSNSGLPANSSVRRLTMDPNDSNTIYASLNQFGNNDPGGLYKSTNGAVSWSQVTIPSDIKSVNNFFIDSNTGFMFISTGARSGALNAGGIWKSENSGATWTRIFEAPYVWQTEVSPVNSNIIVASVPAQVPSMLGAFLNPGIYLSVDAGDTWTKINKGLAHSDRVVDVKPDPDDETILWSAGWGSGWYKAKINNGSLSSKDIEAYKSKVKLYPNPVKNGFLKLDNLDSNSSYKIYNIQGKELQSHAVSNKELINVSNLSSGLYLISIKTLRGTETKKFVIN